MGWLSRTINSSIGRKTAMAVTGLFQAFFVVGHLLGNANTFGGKAAYDSYSAKLHSLGWLLTVFEILLLATFLFHIGFGLYLFLDNRKARPARYAMSRSAGDRTWGARTMPYTGLFLLIFLVDHLHRFRFAGTMQISDLVRDNLIRPPVAGFYIVAFIALGLHLSHGLWSLWQSLGFNHPKYETFLWRAAFALSIAIGALFSTIPLLALFWPGFLR